MPHSSFRQKPESIPSSPFPLCHTRHSHSPSSSFPRRRESSLLPSPSTPSSFPRKRESIPSSPFPLCHTRHSRSPSSSFPRRRESSLLPSPQPIRHSRESGNPSFSLPLTLRHSRARGNPSPSSPFPLTLAPAPTSCSRESGSPSPPSNNPVIPNTPSVIPAHAGIQRWARPYPSSCPLSIDSFNLRYSDAISAPNIRMNAEKYAHTISTITDATLPYNSL